MRVGLAQPRVLRPLGVVGRGSLRVADPEPDSRGAAADLGIPAITVEIGDPSLFQYRYIKRSLVGIRNILSQLEMLKKNSSSATQKFSKPVICEKSQWVYTDSGGILKVLPGLTDMVKSGQQIAQLQKVRPGIRIWHDTFVAANQLKPIVDIPPRRHLIRSHCINRMAIG